MRCNHVVLEKLKAAAQLGCLYVPETEAERLAVRRKLKKGEVVEPYPGLYALRSTHDGASPRARAFMLIKALAKLNPDWVFCSFSAAVVHGIQVPNAHIAAVHTGVKPGSNRKRSGKSVCRSSEALAAERKADVPPVEVVQGIRVTTIEQTVLECLCQAGFRDGLVIADSALHCGLTSKNLLERQFLEWGGGRRGIRRARITLAHASPDSESGGESIVRAIIIELGFEVPQLQVTVPDPMEPNNPKRVDMAWRLKNGTLVILEVDGKIKYYRAMDGHEKTVREMASAFSKERLRESHLNMTGAMVLRCSVEDALDTVRFQTMLEKAGIPKVKRSGN